MPEFKPLAGGFLPRCWTDGRQVLKLWEDGLPISLFVLAGLDLPVVVPMATAVVAGWGVAVFPFVSGREGASGDAPVLARTMRRLHEHPLIDLPRPPVEESWALETMRGRLDHPWISDRRGEVEAQLDLHTSSTPSWPAAFVMLLLGWHRKWTDKASTRGGSPAGGGTTTSSSYGAGSSRSGLGIGHRHGQRSSADAMLSACSVVMLVVRTY